MRVALGGILVCPFWSPFWQIDRGEKELQIIK
jgi:hypothetical protein